MRHKMLFFILMVLLLPVTAGAMERFDVVTTEELHDMLAQRQAGALDFILVNSLDEIIYRDAAIPGSINLPWHLAGERAQLLGGDKQKLIVTY